jgi:hypothetical protein
MAIATFTKDPDATLDYQINWATWLADDDTISNSSFISNSDDITVESSSFTDTTSTVWLSGGQAGSSYEITNRITTTLGRIDDRTIKIKCKDL